MAVAASVARTPRTTSPAVYATTYPVLPRYKALKAINHGDQDTPHHPRGVGRRRARYATHTLHESPGSGSGGESRNGKGGGAGRGSLWVKMPGALRGQARQAPPCLRPLKYCCDSTLGHATLCLGSRHTWARACARRVIHSHSRGHSTQRVGCVAGMPRVAVLVFAPCYMKCGVRGEGEGRGRGLKLS